MARTTSGGSSPTPEEDSGLIDLRAMMAKAAAAERAREEVADAADARESLPDDLTPLPVVRRLELYPFGPPAESAPPPVAPAPRPRPARPWRLAAAAIAAVGAAGAVMGLLLAGGLPGGVEQRPAAPVPAAPTATNTESILAPPPTGAPEAPAPAAPAPPEETAKDAVKPTAIPTPKPAVKAWRPPPARKPSPEAAPATPPPAKPAPADPCNGDLMCAMKRATEGR